MDHFAERLSAAFEHFSAGRLAEAERGCQEILAAGPDHVQALHLLGLIAAQSGRAGFAVECLGRAILLKGEDAELYNNLGMAYALQGELEQAISCHRRAIELQASYAAAHNNLGNALKEQGQLAEAAESYRQALRLSPAIASAHYNLGLTLQEQEKQQEAVESFRKTLEIDPTHADAHNALANSLRFLGEPDEAVGYFQRALELQPDLAIAHTNLAGLLLLKGDLDRGWPEYEWRWKTPEAVAHGFRQPQWDGSPLTGKTILVHAEQGIGDTFQFIRYAAMLKELGATVIVQVQKQLLQILQHCLGVDQLIAEGDEPPAFDLHVPLLGIPGILKTTLSTIPAGIPYLFANPALLSLWRSRLETIPGFHIGINWHGRAGRGDFNRRNIPLEHFASLTSLPGVQWFCLQKDLNSVDLNLLVKCPQIIIPRADLDPLQGAFVDTAAVMMNLDLVITSDTSVAHLAGALGVPVWVALPFVPDWRWLLERSDSPWYPTMRLFRQKTPGDWAGVFQEIRATLQEVLSGRDK